MLCIKVVNKIKQIFELFLDYFVEFLCQEVEGDLGVYQGGCGGEGEGSWGVVEGGGGYWADS